MKRADARVYCLLTTCLLVLCAVCSPVGANVVLEVWSLWTEDHPINVDLKAIAEVYEANHPGVTVNITAPPDIANKLKVAVAAGVAPDVTFANGGVISNKATFPDLLQPLTPLMQRDGVLTSYLPASLQSFCRWDGVVYAAPYSVDPNFAVLYNRDLFQEGGIDPDSPPNTPSELVEINRRLVRTDPDGQLTQIGIIPWRMYGEHTALINWSLACGGVQVSDGRRYTLDHPSVIEALEWMNDFGDAIGGNKAIDALGSAYQYHDLGNIAMQPLVSANAAEAVIHLPDVDYGLTWLPATAGGVAPIWLGGQWLAIPKGAQHPTEAWDFIRFATLDLDAIGLSALSRFSGAEAAYSKGVYAISAYRRGGMSTMMSRIFAFYASLAPQGQPILEAPIWYWSDIAQEVRKVVVDHELPPREAMVQLNSILNKRLDTEVYGQ